MTTQLFNRKGSVIVDGARIEGLRFTFAIEKKDTREANKATVTITNLAPESRARFEVKGLSIIVEAGYDDGVGAIFIGTSYRTSHKRTGPDITTTIEAADGGKEISASAGSWSYKSRTQATSVIHDVVASLGLPLSTGSRITPKPPVLAHGWAFVGNAADALDAITKASGLSWSVQDGQVQILDASIAGDGTVAVALSSATGMLGSPERVDVKSKNKAGVEVTVKRVSVRCLMIPQIRPGRQVTISSIEAPALSGPYVVKTQKINGDTHGDDWTMTLEVQGLSV